MSRTADSGSPQHLVTRGAVLSGQRARLGPAFGDLFQAPGLAVQALQIAADQPSDRETGSSPRQPIAERSRCSSGDRRSRPCAPRTASPAHHQPHLPVPQEPEQPMRRIPQIVCRLQPHGLCRQRDIFRRARSDSLDLFQAEAQQVDLAGSTLGRRELSQRCRARDPPTRDRSTGAVRARQRRRIDPGAAAAAGLCQSFLLRLPRFSPAQQSAPRRHRPEPGHRPGRHVIDRRCA